MSKNKVYCSAPWNGLTIRENGDVKTCCVGSTTLGNLNNVSIKDIEKSEALKEICNNMHNGLPDSKNCAKCIHHESQSGLASLRQYYNKYYPSHDQLHLKFIDVRWNNTCNLSCVYCTPMFSSTWSDRLNIKPPKSVKVYQDELLDWMLERADQVNEIMLVGGEPMLMKQNYALLKKLPIECKVSIITNMSYDLEALPCLPDLLKKSPDTVVWNVSMENIKEKFEYVRTNADWEQMEKNLKFLVKHWPNSISINMVYNLLSAFDLVETIQYFHQCGIQKFNLVGLERNPEIDIFNMPDDIKHKALLELYAVKEWHYEAIHPEDRDFYPIGGIDHLISTLKKSNNTTPITQELFNKKIKWYDQWTPKPFKNLWPELFNLTKQTLV